MKQVSSDYKTAIRKPKQIDGKILINGEQLSSNIINEITPFFNTGLFKTIMKGVELDLSNIISKNVVVNPFFGIYVNNQFEYIDYGNYLITKEPEKNEDTNSYKATGYDKIVDSMIDYDLTVDYPISIRNYWLAIFNRLGWDVTGIPKTFRNSTKMINQDVHSGIGYTFRDVLDELCTISGVWLVDKNGIPTIAEPIETNETIDETYFKDTNVTVGEKVFFNSLVFARAEESDNIYRKDDDSIEEKGLHEFRIIDNQLLSTNDRDLYIDELWNYIKNFEYYSFDIDSIGITFLEPIDKFTLSVNNQQYSTILLNDTTSINQGLAENIYSESPEETITEYKYADTTDKKINRTYILVDKQNQAIQAVVNEQSNQSAQLSQLQITNNMITQQVSSMQTTVDEANAAVTQIENQVQQTITDNNAQFEVINSTLENGVEKLKNNLVTIDINGINVQFNDENFKTLMTNKNFVVKDGAKEIAFFGYDDSLQKTIARIKELETERITAGYHRCEGFTDGLEKRTGWFYVGGVD